MRDRQTSFAIQAVGKRKSRMPKILLVEDDVIHREMVSRYLGLAGYEVVAAGDGSRAVELSRSELPDLILMDMGLPVLNGWLATQQIKGTPDTQSIPIIALTAYAMVEERD